MSLSTSSSETLLPLEDQSGHLPLPQRSPSSDGDIPITIRLEIPAESPAESQEWGDRWWHAKLDQFCLENKEKIDNSLNVTSLVKGEQSADLTTALNGFMQTASVILDGLDTLGNVHPVLEDAIGAFHGVVEVDSARRDNDKKTLTVLLHMQSMMCAMFQLRNVKDSQLRKADINEEKSPLQLLVEQVTHDINSCRSNLEYYSKRKFISKLINAKNYEQIFADHIQIFTRKRSELQTTITAYTITGIHNENLAVADVGNKLEIMDKKFESMIFEIFRKLDTPRERKFLDFLDKNGGPRQCIDNPELLRKLLSEVGESISTGKTGQADFTTIQNNLKEELVADLKQALEKNQAKFEKLLNVQLNNMKHISEQMGQVMVDQRSQLGEIGEILTKVKTVMVYEEGKLKTKAVVLKDQEIQQVWERMGLDRRSVKAKHFVLTFRDHIMTGYSMPTTPRASRPMELHGDDLLFSENAPSPGGLQTFNQEVSAMEKNRWSLEYVDAAYVQPIVEAMDDDGSGFISVQEASKFALARPKELSLLHWIAYWAAGWHLNLANCRWNIYSVLLEIHALLPSIHVANKTYIDDYLSDISFRRVETVLRSIRPLPQNASKDPKLCEMAISIANAELRRLNANLKEMSFLLESATDVADIGGEGRVETWILPLLFLVLKRHLAVMKIGQKIALDTDELVNHSNSLQSIFSVFDERMQSLEAKFRQVHRDVDSQFETFAYGMFFTSFKKKECIVSENTTLSFRQADPFCHPLVLPDSAVEGEGMDLSILAMPRGPQFEFEEDDIDNVTLPDGHVAHPIEGSWTCFRLLGDHSLILQPAPILFNIRPIVDGKIEGKGLGCISLVSMSGSIGSRNTDGGIEVQFRISSPGEIANDSFICKGRYLSDRDVIQGHWNAVVEAASAQVVDWSTALDPAKEDTDTTIDVHGQGQQANEVEEAKTEGSNTIIGSPGQEQDSEEYSTDALTDNNGSIPMKGQGDVQELDNATQTPSDETAQQGIENGAEASDAEQTIDQDVDPDDEVASQANSAYTMHTEELYRFGEFTFRRTPPDAIRSRNLIDNPPSILEQASLSRKRWAFAISAVLERVQTRMGSVTLFRKRMAERRKWIELSIRLDLADRMLGYSYHRSFSEQAVQEWADLILNVHPRIGRIFEAIARYWEWRDIYYMGGNLCDDCRRIITFVRYQCITCMREDMSNQVDFCTDCYDRAAFSKFSLNNDFAHKISHSLIRSTRLIQKYELAHIIPNERDWSEKLKIRFEGLEMNTTGIEKGNKLLKGGDDSVANKTIPEPPPRCGCCNKEIELPCFVCVQCALFFICLDCQDSHIPLMKDNPSYRTHTHIHPLLRIHDSQEVRPIKSEYDQLERQLEDMEVRINEKFTDGLSALERKIARQFKRSRISGESGEEDEEGSAVADSGADDEESLSEAKSLASGIGNPSSSELPQTPALEEQKIPELDKDSRIITSDPVESKMVENQNPTRINVFETKVEARLNALETKMDAIISLLHRLAPVPESEATS